MHKKDHQDKNWWFLITFIRIDRELLQIYLMYKLSKS